MLGWLRLTQPDACKTHFFLAGNTMDIINKLRAATPSPTPPPTPKPAQPATPLNVTGAAAWCFDQHAKEHGPAPAPGNGHNHWLAGVTKFCNERGADLNEVLNLAFDTAPAGHDEAKIRATVEGIYRRDSATHGSKPYTSPSSRSGPDAAHQTSESAGGSHEPPPTFPATVYEALPNFLKRACAPFEGHEKAVMLLSALGVLSGCFPTVGGLYDGQRLGLNLFTLVVGPAAAGKSALRCALALAEPYDERLQAASRDALANYEATKVAHQSTRKSKGGASPPPALAPPPFKMLLLPGNQSAAALYESLNDNDGRGIIGETELDTLSEALKQDWGGFSDVLRKAFHHERLSLKRKNCPPLLLKSPALSLVLSGTPGQVPRLVPDSENGLFSRFWFYLITDESGWRTMGEKSTRPDLTAYFAPLADETTRMMHTASQPATVKLTLEDWDRFNQAGVAALADARRIAGGAGASTAFRLGPIAFRTIAVLTVLRHFDNGEVPTGCLEADPADVSTALALMSTALVHALAVLDMLPTPGSGTSSSFATKAAQQGRIRELHAQGLSIRAIAAQLGISKSTVERWINES